MGIVYDAGRAIVVGAIVLLVGGALALAENLSDTANLLGEYAYLLLVCGVIVIAVSTKVDVERKRGGPTREDDGG